MQYSIRQFHPCTYIMASGKYGTIYVGVTSDLVKRVYQHKNHLFEGFTDQHNITNLVYYECHDMMDGAITREKKLKKWNREWKTRLIEERNPEWKTRLIEERNPEWNDLYDEII